MYVLNPSTLSATLIQPNNFTNEKIARISENVINKGIGQIRHDHVNLTDYKRQADLDHIEEDIFDRPPSTNLTMRLMQIILNALVNSLESAKPPNLINTHTHSTHSPPPPCN